MARKNRRPTKTAQPMPPQMMAALSSALAHDLWRPGDAAKITFDVVRWPTGAPEGQIRRVEVMMSQSAMQHGALTVQQILASRDAQIAEWNQALVPPPAPPAEPPQENSDGADQLPGEQPNTDAPAGDD